MAHQPGWFDVDGRLRELSAKGDALERLGDLVDFELFRPVRRASKTRRAVHAAGRAQPRIP